jgi:hypothetical protein
MNARIFTERDMRTLPRDRVGFYPDIILIVVSDSTPVRMFFAGVWIEKSRRAQHAKRYRRIAIARSHRFR